MAVCGRADLHTGTPLSNFDAIFEELLLTSMLFMMMLLFDCMNFFREVHDNLEGI